jgi:branched-chain amino acid transport system ATP-binding protein
MLKIKNLSAYYGSVRALSGVTMRVREGEIVTLIGANGAGKTTLLNAICGLVRQDGDLAFAGRFLMGLAPEVIVGLGSPRSPKAASSSRP